MTQAENSRNTEQPAGGPAFPCHPDVIPRSDRDYVGMTLRDYFAAKAMQGIVSSIDGEDNYRRLRGHATDAGLSVSEWIACDSYKQADAMLKARDHGAGGSEGDRHVAACLGARKQRDELRGALREALREALQALVDAAWLEDSHAVRFDGTVMFGPSYDFSGIDGWRRAEFREEGIEFVVWPAGDAGGNWSAYSTYDGSLWFELFETKGEAREQCMKLLDQVMPDHPISKARAALAATQPSYDDWIPWEGGECPVERRAVVMVKAKDGEVDTDKAHFYDWDRTGSPSDIIAYRVVKP